MTRRGEDEKQEEQPEEHVDSAMENLKDGIRGQSEEKEAEIEPDKEEGSCHRAE